MLVPRKVLIIEAGRVFFSALALSVDILSTANRIAQTRGEPRPFSISQKTPADVIGSESNADIVVLPGFGLGTEAEVRSAFAEGTMDEVARALAAVRRADTVFATSCSGAFAFGQAGLIDGKRITATWWLTPLLRSMFPAARITAGDLVVEDGPVVTAGAALAHIDLMLHLVERFAGVAIAEDCRRFLIVDDRRSQVPYTSVATLITSDPALRRAELFVHRHLGDAIGIDDLAAASGLGPRTFARRLGAVSSLTPIRFLQQIRIGHAIKLAKTTRLSNDQIAARVGYSDATSLRRVVKKLTGRTLEALRKPPPF